MYRYPFSVQIERGHSIDHERLRVIKVYERFDFTLRSLTRAEYADLQSEFPHPVDFQSAVLERCVLATPEQFHGRPFDWDEFYAGLAAQVYQKILTLSGFIMPGGQMDPEMIEPARVYLSGEEAKYDLLIMTAFDHYRLEDLLDMDPQNWHKLIGLGEAKLRLVGIDPDIILNPGEVERKKALASSEDEAARQMQLMMMKKDGSMPEINTEQIVLTGGGRK